MVRSVSGMKIRVKIHQNLTFLGLQNWSQGSQKVSGVPNWDMQFMDSLSLFLYMLKRKSPYYVYWDTHVHCTDIVYQSALASSSVLKQIIRKFVCLFGREVQIDFKTYNIDTHIMRTKNIYNCGIDKVFPSVLCPQPKIWCCNKILLLSEERKKGSDEYLFGRIFNYNPEKYPCLAVETHRRL